MARGGKRGAVVVLHVIKGGRERERKEEEEGKKREREGLPDSQTDAEKRGVEDGQGRSEEGTSM